MGCKYIISGMHQYTQGCANFGLSTGLRVDHEESQLESGAVKCLKINTIPVRPVTVMRRCFEHTIPSLYRYIHTYNIHHTQYQPRLRLAHPEVFALANDV
jgi:hypothetical protein